MNNNKIYLTMMLFLLLAVFVGCAGTNPKEIVVKEKVGKLLEYRFDEGSGKQIKDSSGNAYNGIINGATWAPGRTSFALKLDGVDDYVDTGLSKDYKHMTFIFWAKHVAIQPRNVTIISKRGSSDSDVPVQIGTPSNTPEYRIILNTSQGLKYVDTKGLQINAWYQIAGVMDGNELRIYVNGQINNSIRFSGIPDTNSNTYKIGCNAQQTKCLRGYFFNGFLDDIVIYNRALTNIEIKDAYDRVKNSV